MARISKYEDGYDFDGLGPALLVQLVCTKSPPFGRKIEPGPDFGDDDVQPPAETTRDQLSAIPDLRVVVSFLQTYLPIVAIPRVETGKPTIVNRLTIV